MKRGDEMKSTDKELARSAYLFAIQFAPNDEAIKAKVNTLGNRVYNMFANNGAGIAKMAAAGEIVESLSDFEGFPKTTPRSDLTNLRMLNDEALVGNLSHAEMQGCAVFISTTRVDIATLREKYGAPDSERKMKNGGPLLTYGMFRIFGDPAGKAVLVIYRPTTAR